MAKSSSKRILQIDLVIPQELEEDALSRLLSKITELGLEDSSLLEVTAADDEDHPRCKITCARLQ